MNPKFSFDDFARIAREGDGNESKGCCFELPHISGPQCFFTNARFEFNATLSVATGLASRCFAGVSCLGVPLASQELCSDSSGRLRVAATDGPIYVRLH